MLLANTKYEYFKTAGNFPPPLEHALNTKACPLSTEHSGSIDIQLDIKA